MASNPIEVLRRRPSRLDIALFTRQLATLLAAGVPIIGALHTLEVQHQHDAMGPITSAIASSIDRGRSLLASFEEHRATFGGLYLSMIATGEAGGSIDACLLRVADYLEKEAALRSRLSAALTYPLFCLIVTVILTWAIGALVLPTFLPLFAALSGSLPWPTQVLMVAVEVMRTPWLTAVTAVCAYVLASTVAGLLRTSYGQKRFFRLLMRLPALGRMTRNLSQAQISRGLSTMLAVGIPLVEAVGTLARSLPNKVYRDDLREAGRNLKHGLALAQHLSLSPRLYSPMLAHMAAVGAETGKLDFMLGRAANMLEADVEYEAELLTTLVQPALLTAMSVVVGFISIAVFLPLYGSLQTLGGS